MSKFIFVFGLGVSGSGIVKFFLSQKGVSKIYCFDKRGIEAITPNSSIYEEFTRAESSEKVEVFSCLKTIFETLQRHKKDSETEVYLSPGFVASKEVMMYMKDNEITVKSDIDILHSLTKGAFHIGVTGSNGKSTIVSWLNHSINKLIKQESEKEGEDLERRFAGFKSCFLCGNIGVSACEVEAISSREAIYITELSSYQIDISSRIELDIAILNNVFENHLDVYGEVASYVGSKKKIFTFLKDGGAAVLPSGDSFSSSIANELKGSRNTVSVFCGEDISGLFAALCSQDNLGVNGSKVFKNINAPTVFLVLKKLGYDDQAIIEAMSDFSLLKHRNELIGNWRGYEVVNDSKATNVAACLASLSFYDEVIWIVGGKRKGDDINALEAVLNKVIKAFIIGEDTGEFETFFKTHKVDYSVAGRLDRAMAAIYSDVVNEGIKTGLKESRKAILLLPGCSSLDQWKSFEERGDAFREISRLWQD